MLRFLNVRTTNFRYLLNKYNKEFKQRERKNRIRVKFLKTPKPTEMKRYKIIRQKIVWS